MGESIPRLRASVVCCQADKLLTVRSTDPVTHRDYLFLPGGAIEPGETPEQAALRETLEETGYQVRLRGAAIRKQYRFDWSHRTYACDTHFFAANLVDPAAAPVSILEDPILHGVLWMPVAEVEQAFSYSTEILEAVAALLA